MKLPKLQNFRKSQNPRFDFKRLFVFAKSLLTVRNAIIVVVLIAGYFFLTSSIFYVDSVDVSKIEGQKFIVTSDIFTCTKSYLGKNIFAVNVNDVISSVEKCSVLVKNVRVNKNLPSKIDIQLEEIVPTVKFLFKDDCYLVDDKVIVKKIQKQLCDRYLVPSINNLQQADNTFLLSSMVRVIVESKKAVLDQPTSFEIVLEGQTTFIKANYQTHSVIFSPNLVAEQYVTQYANTIKGLKERNESFQQLDFRFDRVIVR